MRVYVESNFVLELVLEQEEHSPCDELVEHAEAGRLTLALPAFAIYEPYTTLYRRARERAELQQLVQRELTQLQRTKALASDAASSELPALFVQATQHAEERFEAVTGRLLAASQVLPLSADVLARARKDAARYGLKLGDALVLASVLADPELGKDDSCFLNRNTKDFSEPALRDALKKERCIVFGKFAAGLQYVESRIRGTPTKRARKKATRTAARKKGSPAPARKKR